jgi:hypothetical protein
VMLEEHGDKVERRACAAGDLLFCSAPLPPSTKCFTPSTSMSTVMCTKQGDQRVRQADGARSKRGSAQNTGPSSSSALRGNVGVFFCAWLSVLPVTRLAPCL